MKKQLTKIIPFTFFYENSDFMRSHLLCFKILYEPAMSLTAGNNNTGYSRAHADGETGPYPEI
jgi:hypothetical protein